MHGLFELTKRIWGFGEYFLGRYSIGRYVAWDMDTEYLLEMEWFPNRYIDWEGEESPEGTVTVSINIETNVFTSVIVAGGNVYTKGLLIPQNKSEICQWLEQKTGISIQDRFLIKQGEERELYLVEKVNSIEKTPGASIQITYNEQGFLTFFSIYNESSMYKKVKQGHFSLKMEHIEEMAKEQCSILDWPIENDTILPIYALTETYVRNDQAYTIPYDDFFDLGRRFINQRLIWDNALEDTFQREYIPFEETTELTFKQAMEKEPHPDTKPLSPIDIEKSIQLCKQFLQMKYPDESGEWILISLERNIGTIHAKLSKHPQKIINQRKMLIMLDYSAEKIMNYIDNKEIWEERNANKRVQKPILTKEQAYEKIKPFITLKPVYVYDEKEHQYVLCGKVDCDHYIDIQTGEIGHLNEII